MSSPYYQGYYFPWWFWRHLRWKLEPHELHLTHRAQVRRIYDRENDCVMTVEVETGEILVWRYRTPSEGGYDEEPFSTFPRHIP